MHNLELHVSNFLKKYNIEGKIAVAVSGGSDSLGLMYLLSCFSFLDITAITVDHALREDSASEALYVKSLSSNLSIKHEILEWKRVGYHISGNLQAEARKKRYQLLISYCIENKIEYLFIAHNKEDVAENFLLRLKRGSGLDGLSAMGDNFHVKNTQIFRPLLEISKKKIQEYLIEKNVKWVEDPSNKNEKFDRVKIRNDLRGQDLYIDRIFLAAKHLRKSREYIAKKMKETINKIVHIGDLGEISLNWQEYINLTEYEQMTILTMMLQFVSGASLKPRFKSLQNVMEHILVKGFKNITFMHCQIMYFSSKIIVFPEIDNLSEEIPKDILYIWRGRFIFKFPDKDNKDLSIEMLGKRKWQYLDKISLKIDNNLPKEVIYSLPCIMHLEKILAIPHIKYYSDELLKNISVSLLKSSFEEMIDAENLLEA